MFGNRRKPSKNGGTGSKDPETKGSRKKVIKWVIAIPVVVGLLALALFSEGGVFAKQKEGMCIPPTNSIYVTVNPGTYQIPNSNKQVTVVRGIRNGETVVEGNVNTEIPECFSEDSGLVQVHNLWVQDPNAGHPVVLPVAVIVNELQEVESDTETPLP